MLILYTIQRKHYFEPWLISKHCTYVDHFESVVNLPYKSEIWFCRRGKFVGVLTQVLKIRTVFSSTAVCGICFIFDSISALFVYFHRVLCNIC